MSSLFVGNLSSHVRHRDLENSFKRFGKCNLELKEGFGFVIFEDHRDATRALEALQGRSLCGEQPSISWARKRRPFQRFSGKGNFVGRERYHSRRRPSLEADKGSDDGRRDQKLDDEMKDGVRASEVGDEPARSTERDAEWKDSGRERSMFDEETKDADPLDSGRWDPHMEGSPDNILVDGLLEDGQHPSGDKDKEDERGSVHEKSQGSPRDRHHDRPSRVYRNSSDQHKRGRDTFGGRQQERCYNCGQSGHVKWQCRSRPRRINMHSREGGFDGRRNDFRYPGIRGGFRGVGGNGRFWGSNGSRRILTRDIEPGYARRSLRRHDMDIDRKHSDPGDTKIREKSRRRRRKSESPWDSSSRGRSKRKHKKSSKKSTRSKKNRKQSSSASPSSSRSPRSASSSSSRSRSHSGSESGSSKSGSQSSGSGSGSGSRSCSSDSQSSRSRSLSASSSSRSHSASSRSRKSVSKSKSRSPLSHSPALRGISSPSPKVKRTFSSPRSSSTGGSQSSAFADDKQKATSIRRVSQDKESHEMAINDEQEKKDNSNYFSEFQDVDQQDAQRSERRWMWSREAKKQKMQTRSEEHPFEAETQTNGVAYAVKADDSCSREPGSLKGSEAIVQGQVPDMGLSMYVAIRKEGSRGVGSGQDWANSDFGAARLWPWEAMLYRRLKRGPVSTANYERRKAQNEEFGIKDTFVRSSSGWWENHSEE